MSAFRPILFIIGIFVVTMGLAMIVPAITDAIAGHRDWITFAISAGCAAFVGGLLVTGPMGSPITLTLRHGFPLTTLSWLVVSPDGALPLAFPRLALRYAHPLFSPVPGLTPPGTTLWVALDPL